MISAHFISPSWMSLVVGLGSWLFIHRLQRRKSISEFLTGKTVWITGASSGLGEELAIIAASSKASTIILSGRNEAQLKRVYGLCTNVSEDCTKIFVVPFDLSDSSKRNRVSIELLEKFGTIHVLVNNAGISMRSASVDTEMDVERKIMETNFFAAVELSKKVLPNMLNERRGHIVVINSVQGKLGIPFRSSYSASKHALTGYFDSLRAEVNQASIGVTAVFPGYLRTNLSLNALTGSGNRYATMDENTSKGMDPSKAAKIIWEGVANGKREIFIAPLHVRIACILRAVAPHTFMRIMNKRALKGQ